MSAAYRTLPSLQTLRCFEAAARFGSFTQAAEELCITHSAVSHQIKLLEESIGQGLFKRVGNRMVLTLAGSTLAVETRRALDYLSQAYAVARIAAPARRESLIFATQTALLEHLLLPHMTGLRALLPEVQILFQSVPDLVGTCSSEADVALLYGTGDVPGMIPECIAEEEVFPVCSPAYLASHPDLSPETLSDHALLLHSRVTWNLWLEKARLPIAYPADALFFDDIALTIRSALLGLGIAMVRSHLAHDYIARGELVRLFDLSVPGVFSYQLAWRDERTRNRFPQLGKWLTSLFGRGANQSVQ